MARRSLVVIFLILLGLVVLFVTENGERLARTQAPHKKPQAGPATSGEQNQKPQVTEVASQAPVLEMKGREIPPDKIMRKTSSLDLSKGEFEKIPLLSETKWKLWHGVRAVPKSSLKSTDIVLTEISNFAIVKSDVDSEVKNFSALNPLVVVDQRLGLAGIITGTISVVLKDNASADFLTEHPEIKVVGSFPKIKTYFVSSSSEPFDLEALVSFIKAEPGVEQSTLEILSRNYDKF